MSCGCGKGKGNTVVAQVPSYFLVSEPLGDDQLVYIQSTMQVISQSFRRVFSAGTNIIVPESYAQELLSLNASVVLI